MCTMFVCILVVPHERKAIVVKVTRAKLTRQERGDLINPALRRLVGEWDLTNNLMALIAQYVKWYFFWGVVVVVVWVIFWIPNSGSRHSK